MTVPAPDLPWPLVAAFLLWAAAGDALITTAWAVTASWGLEWVVVAAALGAVFVAAGAVCLLVPLLRGGK